MKHALAQLQDAFDEEGSALVVRRYIVPSLHSEPAKLTSTDRAHVGRALLLAALLILFIAVVLP